MRKLFIVLIMLLSCKLQAQSNNYETLTPANIRSIVEISRFGDGMFTGEAHWSLEGDKIAVPASLGVWLFDSDNLNDVELLSQETAVNDVAWSNDGLTLVIATDESTQVWDIVQQQAVQAYDGAIDLAYSPDGAYLVLTIEDQFGNTGLDVRPNFRVINVTTNIIIGEIAGAEYATGQAFFTSNSQFLVTESNCYLPEACEYPTTFQVWDMSAPLPHISEMGIVEYPMVGQVIVGNSPIGLNDGRVAYINYEQENTIALLNVASGEQLVIAPQVTDINRLFVSNSDLFAYSAFSSQARLQQFDIASGTFQGYVEAPSLSDYIASPQDKNRVIATNQNRVALLRLENTTFTVQDEFDLQAPVLTDIHPDAVQLETPPHNCRQLENASPQADCGIFNMDRTLFVGQNVSSDVYLWDVTTGEGSLIQDIEPNDHASNFVFINNQVLVYTISDCLMNGRCTASSLYIFDIQQNSNISELQFDVIRQVAYADNTNLLGVVTDNSVEFVDTENATVITTMPNIGAGVARIAFSTDGSLLLSSHSDDTVRLWGVPIQ